jgi:hypothetical protein
MDLGLGDFRVNVLQRYVGGCSDIAFVEETTPWPSIS